MPSTRLRRAEIHSSLLLIRIANICFSHSPSMGGHVTCSFQEVVNAGSGEPEKLMLYRLSIRKQASITPFLSKPEANS